MKKLLTILILLLAVVTQGWADISLGVNTVWTGSEKISWNTEVVEGTQFESTNGTFTGLLVGDKIVVTSTLTEGYSSDPQYVLTYKAGDSWDWTDLTTSIESGTINYTVASKQIATEIAERGLVFRGQGYTITKIEVIRGYKITITSPTNGTITVKNGDSNVNSGDYVSANTSLTLTATPADDYSFAKWTIGGEESTENPHTLTITEATSIAATFTANAIPAFSLDGFAADENNTYNGETHALTTTSGWSGMQLWIGNNSTYNGNKLVVKTAEDCKLKITVGYVGEGQAELSDETANKNHAVTIDNTKKIQKVIIQNQEAGTVTFSSMELDPSYTLTINQPENGKIKNGESDAVTGTYSYGTEITLTAAPSDTYELLKWSDGTNDLVAESDGSLKVTMDGDKSVTAVFGKARTTKDLSTGSTKINGSTSVVIHKGMFANASVGDVITINISSISTPSGKENPGYAIKGAGEDETENSTYNWQWIEGGNLTTDATSIIRTITSDDLAILKASGLSIEGDGIYTCGDITLSTAGEVGTAQTHTNPTFTLTINEAIGGSVKVKQDNTETNERTFALETEVTLEPVANTGFTFSKWMKGDTEQTAGENNSLTLSITDNVSVTALFNAQALADNSSLTIWQGEKEASWGELLQLTSSVTNILEQFETIRITASPMESVTGPDAYFKVFFNTIGGDSKIVDWESAKITGANQVVEYNLPTTTIVDQLKGGFGIFGQNVKITKVELIKPTIPVALADEEKRTVWSDETGVALNWGNNEISISALDSHILKAGDQVIVTSIVNQPESGDPWPKAFLADGSKAVSPTIDGTECIITLTSEIVEKIKDGFYISGGDSKAKKIEFYKPVVIFVDGEANLERGVEDGGKTTFTALHDEAITGNVLVVESNENATVKVTFSDNTTATNKPGDRKIGNPTGSQALVLLDRSKFIKTIEIDKAKAAITKIYMSSLTLFEKSGEDYIADLSLAKAMDNTTFDTSSYTIATTVAWSGGIQLDVLEGETVKGKELMIQTESDADLKVTVEYESGDKTEVQDRPASKEMKVVIDGNRAVKQILIQPKTASVTKLLKVAVNASATPDPNVFSKDDKGNFVADLSMVKAEGATYNNTTFTMVATDSWQGVTVTPGNAEVVKGKELYIEFDKAALGYAKISYVDDETSVEGGLDAAGTVMKIALDDSKQISKIEIKLKEAGTAKFKKIAVNATETADESGDDDEEAIIDEKTGEADLAQLAAQDDTKTTLTQNEDGSITMTTTEAYQAAQIWFNDPEVVAGNVLKV